MTAIAPPRVRSFTLDWPFGHVTLSGFAARINSSDGPGPKPIEALVATVNGHVMPLTFARDGRFDPPLDSPFDLMNADPPLPDVVGFIIIAPRDGSPPAGCMPWTVIHPDVIGRRGDADRLGGRLGGLAMPLGFQGR